MAEPQGLVHLACDGHCATLTLNDPEKLNAFSEPAMIDAFIDALAKVKADRTIRVLILTGAGRAFSAGGNVKHMRARSDMFAGKPAAIQQAYQEGILRVPPLLYGLDIPVIAAVNGPAFGAGLDLVCMADLRVAAHSATFGTPFVKIGIAPGDGAAWFLPRIIGLERAARMLFTAEPIDAAAALTMGLVGEVVDDADLLPTAQVLAAKIAANAPLAVRYSKMLLREAMQQPLEAHLRLCAAYQAILHHSDDHLEALEGFFDKRPGAFSGS